MKSGALVEELGGPVWWRGRYLRLALVAFLGVDISLGLMIIKEFTP